MNSTTDTLRLIVIGNGMVGQRLLETLCESAGHSHAVRWHITVLCEEPRPAYDRVQLSSFFSGKSADDLSLVKPGFFEEQGIELCLKEGAKSLDRERRCVITTTGRELAYDRLVLATGSYPFVPPVPGKERKDCFVYRTIEDLEAIREAGARSKSGVVIGGGLLGLEAAKALKDLGLETHVVESTTLARECCVHALLSWASACIRAKTPLPSKPAITRA
jgi:nitrite reductase (NADH) large subunit